MKTEKVVCDLCGCDKYIDAWDKLERSKTIDGIKLLEDDDGVYNYLNVQCTNCGLIYIQNRVVQEDMDEYYDSMYRYDYRQRIDDEKNHATACIEYLRGITIDTKKSLDVGCGAGALVEQFKLNGFDAYGIDLTDKCFEFADACDIKVEKANILDYDDSGFGAITMLNTLEHTHSPSKVLKKVRSMLVDDGIIFISVPSFTSTNIRLIPDGFMSNMHLYTFDVQTLSLYLRLHGFEIRKLSIVQEYNMDKLYAMATKCEHFGKFPKHIRIVKATDYLNCWEYMTKCHYGLAGVI